MKGEITMNATLIFPGFETLVRPFKIAANPNEYKVTALRACPTLDSVMCFLVLG